MKLRGEMIGTKSLSQFGPHRLITNHFLNSLLFSELKYEPDLENFKEVQVVYRVDSSLKIVSLDPCTQALVNEAF